MSKQVISFNLKAGASLEACKLWDKIKGTINSQNNKIVPKEDKRTIDIK